jgi:kynurenine formamidase
MRFIELTLPLKHQSMPDEVLPTAVRFFLAPKDHPEKGIVVGSETGSCLVLPSVFADFRKSARIDELVPEKLFLRPTTVLSVDKRAKEEISERDLEGALTAIEPAHGDAVLVRTGWGDLSDIRAEAGAYVFDSPHFSLDAAKYLARWMQDHHNDLLLLDTAIVGWPGKHLIPEWSSLIPRPSPESGETRMYLHLYDGARMKADCAVELEFASRGIMTVRKLIHCGEIMEPRIRTIVAPLQIVRGVASTCRVVALEDAF